MKPAVSDPDTSHYEATEGHAEAAQRTKEKSNYYTVSRCTLLASAGLEPFMQCFGRQLQVRGNGGGRGI